MRSMIACSPRCGAGVAAARQLVIHFYEDLYVWLRIAFCCRSLSCPACWFVTAPPNTRCRVRATSRPCTGATRAFWRSARSGTLGRAYRQVLDQLLRNAAMPLRLGDRTGARTTFDLVLADEARKGWRAPAPIGMLPRSGAAIRLLHAALSMWAGSPV